MSIEFRCARSAQEVAHAYDLVARIFGTSYAEMTARQQQWLRLDPCMDVRDVVIASDGGRVVGVVRVMDRRVYWTGRPVSVSGLTNIGLDAAYRGCGLGRRLMDAALARATERSDAFAILFARRAVDGFYPKFGFVGVGCHPELRVPVEALAALRMPSDVDILAGFRSDDRAAFREWYESSYSELPMSFVRDADWWASAHDRFVLSLGADGPNRIAGIHADGQLVGYAISHQGRVIEAGADACAQARCAAAIAALAGQSQQELVVSLPPAHWLMRRLSRLPHTLSVRYAWNGGHMARLIDPQRLAVALDTPPSVAREPSLAPDPVTGRAPASAAVALETVSGPGADREAGTARLLELLTAGSSRTWEASPEGWPALPAWSIIDEF